MKILFIGSGNNPSTFIKRRINALQESGINVLTTKEIEINLKFPLLFIKKPKRLYYLFKILNLQNKGNFKLRFKKAIKYIDLIETKPDILHFQWINHVQSFKWLIDYFKVPVVASVRGSMVTLYPNNNPTYVESLQKSFSITNYVHCVSESLRQLCIKDFNVNPDKVFTNYNGIDINKFKPNDISISLNNKLRLISIGGLMWRKGVFLQLLILKQLEDYPVELFLVGKGEDEFKLRYQVKKLGLTNKVTFLGNKTENEVIDELQKSDIYLSTSIAEGLSNSVMEAAACGLPIVAFNCEGMDEIIINNESGFIIPFGDIKKMTEKIIYLFKNKYKTLYFGRIARDQVVKNYKIEFHVEKMVNFYKSIK